MGKLFANLLQNQKYGPINIVGTKIVGHPNLSEAGV